MAQPEMKQNEQVRKEKDRERAERARADAAKRAAKEKEENVLGNRAKKRKGVNSASGVGLAKVGEEERTHGKRGTARKEKKLRRQQKRKRSTRSSSNYGRTKTSS